MFHARIYYLASVVWLCSSCALYPERTGSGAAGGSSAYSSGGLAVGFVVNSGASPALKVFERRRYADKIASAILDLNPGLTGHLDSYAYVSARVGKPFDDIINSYRLEGDLSPRALKQLRAKQLRRRYLMLATIAATDQIVELPAEVKQLSGPANHDIEDYENVKLHTVRLKAVKVQTYDLLGLRKIQETVYSSDDDGTMLATELQGRRYVGNSLLAAIANGVSNRVQHGQVLRHPAAPATEVTLDHLWRQVAQSLPGAIKY